MSSNGTRPMPLVAGVAHRQVATTRLTMHVAEAGDGPPVLLLHGWPEHWYAWRKVIPLLASSHRVICVDLRGCGWSDAPPGRYGTTVLADDLSALLDALELDRVSVIGHDVGGRVGFELALRAPDRIDRLVAVNSVHPYWRARRMARHAWRYWWTIPVETPLLGRTVLRRIPAYTRLLFRVGAADNEPIAPDAVDSYVDTLTDRERARAAERLQGDFAYREILPTLLGWHRPARLTVPTLMINGTRDFALSHHALAGYEDDADTLDLRLVKGGGHLLPETHPDVVAAASRDWITRQSSASRCLLAQALRFGARRTRLHAVRRSRLRPNVSTQRRLSPRRGRAMSAFRPASFGGMTAEGVGVKALDSAFATT